MLASGSEDHSLRVWDLRTETAVARLCGHEQLVIDAFTTSRHLFSASFDATVRVWQLGGEWQCLHRLSASRSFEHCHAVAVYGEYGEDCGGEYGGEYGGECATAAAAGAAATPRAPMLLFAGTDDAKIRCWRLGPGGGLGGGPGGGDGGGGGPELDYSLDPLDSAPVALPHLVAHTKNDQRSSSVRVLLLEGRLLFSGADDATIHVWDASMSPPQLEATLRGHKHFIRSLCLCGGGGSVGGVAAPRYLASGSFDCDIRLWSLEAGALGECVRVFARAHEKVVRCLAAGARTHFLFSGSWDGKIKVFNLNSMHCEGTLLHERTYVNCLAASDDFLFTGSKQGHIRVWTPTAKMATVK